MDELYKCLQAYSTLTSTCTYHFVVAKKRKSYSINLQFEMNQFIHLIGIKHLTDLPCLQNKVGNLQRAIKDKVLTMDYLRTSQYFNQHPIDIEARIRCVSRLDEFLQSEHIVVDYLHCPDQSSNIRADWLFKNMIDSEIWYLFVKSKETESTQGTRTAGNYYCLTMFPERGIEYGSLRKPMTILLKERHNVAKNTTCQLYCHPTYSPLGQ